MPGLHRYFGTPLTTWILNRIYHSSYSDIHCGMRGLTRAAFDKIDLKSQSWEYASEMVLKAARLRLATAEVPVKFYKDREGRFSHHRRMGWLSPWIAGWLNLKVMLVYTPDSFLLRPGILLAAIGAVIASALAMGPITIGGVGLQPLLDAFRGNLRNSRLQFYSDRRAGESDARAPRSVSETIAPDPYLRSRDGHFGRLRAGRHCFARHARLPLFACGIPLVRDFASGDLRASPYHCRLPDFLLHLVTGDGAEGSSRKKSVNTRTHEAYGEQRLTFVDRAGVWLSQRAISRHLPKRSDLEVLELGCGFRANQLMALGPRLQRGIGVDFRVAPELRTLEKFTFHEGTIEETLPKLEAERLDAVMLISVLEHLRDPFLVIETARRLLKPSGVLLINVPTWRGKSFLEFSAFRLGLSPRIEMDDHKMYYDKRDLWPLLVRAGFKPSLIKLRYHKLGLNLFAAATRENV